MAPSLKYKAAINHHLLHRAKDRRNCRLCSRSGLYRSEFEKIQQLKNEIKGSMTYYVCCVPELPNTFISSHLLESRLIPWLAFHMNMDGFLRWNYTVWPNDPLHKIAYHYPIFAAGDTNFVYPGRDGQPLLTLRYKHLQKEFGITKSSIVTSSKVGIGISLVSK